MLDHLSELDISRTVFHDIPNKQVRRGATLELSDVETVLDVTNRNLLRGKLVGGLRSYGYPIVVDTSIQSPVPPIVDRNLSGAGQDFVGASRYIAQFLYDKQPPSSLSGVLVMAECRLQSHRALALIKLEQVAGSIPTPHVDRGLRRLDLEYASKVVLTEKVRVLKAGLFVSEGAGINGISGLVVDAQIRDRQRRVAADYFLKQFLGFKLQDDPAQLTKKCFDVVSRWIDTCVEDIQDRFHYRTSLRSEMLRGVNTLNLEQFAIEYLELHHRSSFIGYMASEGVPTHRFLKDLKRISHNLRHTQTEVADGIQIVARAGIPSGQISMVVEDDGSIVITVKPIQET